MESNWKEIKCDSVRCFQLNGDKPELIYFIHHGGDIFIAVQDDAYEFSTGTIEILTKEQILKKYHIQL